MGLNPVATGILTGAISGAAIGFVAGGPVGAAVGATAGGIVGGASAEEAQKAKRAGLEAQKDANMAAIDNQNALVADEYNKKKQARGMAEAVQNPEASGMGTSSGAVLNTMTGNDKLVNVLG
jgi:hypothetical protein